MNLYFIIASLLLLLTSAVHSILGEKLLIIPTLKLNIPPLLGSEFLAKRTLRFAWHLTTVLWLAMAAILILFANQPLTPSDILIVQIFSATFLLSGLVSLIAGHGKHFSWVVFLIIALVLWLGLKQYSNT